MSDEIHISPRKNSNAGAMHIQTRSTPKLHAHRANTMHSKHVNQQDYEHFQMLMADFFTALFGLAGLIAYFFSAANNAMNLHYAFFQHFSQRVTPKALILLLILVYGVTIFLHVNKQIDNQWLQLIAVSLLTLGVPYLTAFISAGTATSGLILFGISFASYYFALAKQKGWENSISRNMIGLLPIVFVSLLVKFLFKGTWTGVLLSILFTTGYILVLSYGQDYFKRFSFTEMSFANIVNFLYMAPYYFVNFLVYTTKGLAK